MVNFNMILSLMLFFYLRLVTNVTPLSKWIYFVNIIQKSGTCINILGIGSKHILPDILAFNSDLL